MLLKDSVGGDLDMVCEILALEDLFTKNERDALQIGKRITHLIKKNLMNKNSHNTININMLNKSISNLLLDKTLARELRKEGDATLNMSDNNDIASRNKKVFILILDRLAKCYKARSKREEIRSAVLELGSDSRNDLATDAGWALIPMTTLEFRLLSNKNMLSIMTSLTFREPSYGECYWRIPSSLNAEDCLKRLNILRNSIEDGMRRAKGETVPERVNMVSKKSNKRRRNEGEDEEEEMEGGSRSGSSSSSSSSRNTTSSSSSSSSTYIPSIFTGEHKGGSKGGLSHVVSNKDVVDLKSCHGMVVCCQKDGTIMADRFKVGAWELFGFHLENNNKWRITTGHETYIVASGKSLTVKRSPGKSNSALWNIKYVTYNGKQYATFINVNTNKAWRTINDDGEINCDGNGTDPECLFYLELASNFKDTYSIGDNSEKSSNASAKKTKSKGKLVHSVHDMPPQIRNLMQEYTTMTLKQACEMSLTQDLYKLVQEGALTYTSALQMLPKETDRHTSLSDDLQEQVINQEISLDDALAQITNTTSGSGLHNYGATCYFNALISALFHIPLVKNMQWSGADTALSSEFLLCRDMYVADDNRVVRPRNLLDNAKNLHEPNTLQLFADRVQQDPSEALSAMFNFENNMGDTGLTRVRDMCTVHQTKNMKCIIGSHAEENKTQPNVFIIHIEFGEGNDLQHLPSPNLTTVLLSTTVTQNEKWGDTCFAYEETMTLQDPLPDIFVVNMKRTRYDRDRKKRVKVMTALNFDQEMVIKNIQYKLYAAILHEGGATGGHYVSRVLKDDEKWYECNDRSVLLVSGPADNSERRQIQMLFYTKTTTPKVNVPKRKRDTTESTKGEAKVISRAKSKVISRAKKKVKVSKTVNLVESVESDEDQGGSDDSDSSDGDGWKSDTVRGDHGPAFPPGWNDSDTKEKLQKE